MISKKKSNGEMFLLTSAILEGLFPIIAHHSSQVFPPISFLTASSLIAAVIFFLYLLLSGQFPQKIPKKAILYSLGVAVFVMMTYTLIFVGTSMTSAINTSLILQAEVLFAFIVGSLVLNERIKSEKILGAIFIVGGTTLVLFNGTVILNRGDLLILLATMIFPIGNTFAKKAMTLISNSTLLFLRYTFGSVLLIAASFLFEGDRLLAADFPVEKLWLIPTYAVLILVSSKVCWYMGLKTHSIGRSTSIIISAPAFSLLFAYFLLGEIPTIYQISGFMLTIIGITVLARLLPLPWRHTHHLV